MNKSFIGKEAENCLSRWLDRPEKGYCFDRIKDQLSMYANSSSNICDFTLFKSPYYYYIECKATAHDRFDFKQLRGYPDSSDTKQQYGGLLNKSKISNVYGVVVILFVSYERAFIIDIREIERLTLSGKLSLNIKDIESWNIQYREIQTKPNNRKKYLKFDYIGEFTVNQSITESGDLQ